MQGGSAMTLLSQRSWRFPRSDRIAALARLVSPRASSLIPPSRFLNGRKLLRYHTNRPGSKPPMVSSDNASERTAQMRGVEAGIPSSRHGRSRPTPVPTCRPDCAAQAHRYRRVGVPAAIRDRVPPRRYGRVRAVLTMRSCPAPQDQLGPPRRHTGATVRSPSSSRVRGRVPDPCQDHRPPTHRRRPRTTRLARPTEPHHEALNDRGVIPDRLLRLKTPC